MKENIKKFIQDIETQNNIISFDVDSCLEYKNSILVAVMQLFENKNADEVLQDVKEEFAR